MGAGVAIGVGVATRASFVPPAPFPPALGFSTTGYAARAATVVDAGAEVLGAGSKPGKRDNCPSSRYRISRRSSSREAFPFGLLPVPLPVRFLPVESARALLPCGRPLCPDWCSADDHRRVRLRPRKLPPAGGASGRCATLWELLPYSPPPGETGAGEEYDGASGARRIFGYGPGWRARVGFRSIL